MDEEIKLFIALIVASWSALGVATKCVERMNPTRNILLGIDQGNRVQTKEIGEFILLRDFVGFALGMILVFLSVGIILVVVSYSISGVSHVLSWLYFISGGAFITSSIFMMFSAPIDYNWIKKRIAVKSDYESDVN